MINTLVRMTHSTEGKYKDYTDYGPFKKRDYSCLGNDVGGGLPSIRHEFQGYTIWSDRGKINGIPRHIAFTWTAEGYTFTRPRGMHEVCIQWDGIGEPCAGRQMIDHLKHLSDDLCEE